MVPLFPLCELQQYPNLIRSHANCSQSFYIHSFESRVLNCSPNLIWSWLRQRRGLDQGEEWLGL